MTDKLNVNTIKPAGSAITLGVSGSSVVMTDDVKVNTVKDAGDGYKIEAFKATGSTTWTCPTGVSSIEVLIVAGGGGGSAPYYAGGGGAGGVVHAAAYPVTAAVVYDLTVGAGGTNGNATAGGNSVFNVNGEGSNTTVLTANGGGGGGGGGGPAGGGAGGSGGGTDNDASSGGASNQPAAFGSPQIAVGYGNSGGAVGGNTGGGGGGASTAAVNSIGNNIGGAGGAGKLFSNFTAYGTTVKNEISTGSDGGYFGGGGGGGSNNNGPVGGPAGVGGGGIGGGTDTPSYQGTQGQANTGGGGGGGDTNGGGKPGGSGIVLIRYLSPATTLFTSNGSGVLTGVNAGFGSSMKLLSTQTVGSAVAQVDFTNAITGAFTNTYREYIFEWINTNSSDDGQNFYFNASDDGSNYDVPKVSSSWWLKHDGGTTAFESKTSSFGKEGATIAQLLQWGIGNASGEGASGRLVLYDPAGTTYAKHWISRANEKTSSAYSIETTIQGYYNTTSAITGIRFTMDSGNVNTGIFKMYGVL